MEILKQLSENIKTLEHEDNCLVVAVCSAADLGKTYISAQLADCLCQMGLSANFLTLDSYLMNRADRIRRGISGYQPEAYDLSSVQKDLERFKNGRPIEYFPYDHSSGETVSNKKTIKPCTVLIVDGLHSMNDALMPFVNFSIFVCTTDDQLIEIRHQADITKRKQPIEFSRNNAATEFNKYKQLVEPYKKMANVVLFLKEQWNYILIEGE